MNRSHVARCFALAGLLALAAGLLVSGCAKKISTPDASRSKLEGQTHPDARMVVWPVLPSYFWAISDTTPQGNPDPNGFHLEHTLELRRPTADAYHFQILDRSNASRYEVFGRSANGALLPLFDYAIAPRAKWLDTNWELYSFTSTPDPGNPSAAFVARGVVAGLTGTSSPLTNLVPVSAIDLRQTLDFVSQREQPDSALADIRWTADSRAAGYWLEVLPFDDVDTLVTTYGQYNEAMPAIEPPGAKRALHVFIPAPTTSAATISFQDSRREVISTKLLFFMHKAFIVRVCAVDPNGRVINRLKTDFRRVPPSGDFYFPVGGVVFGFFTTQDRLQGRGLNLGHLTGGDLLVPWTDVHPTP